MEDPHSTQLGNGRITVSGVLFRKRELTEFCGKLQSYLVSSAKNSVSLRWLTKNRLREELTEFSGPELGEGSLSSVFET